MRTCPRLAELSRVTLRHCDSTDLVESESALQAKGHSLQYATSSSVPSFTTLQGNRLLWGTLYASFKKFLFIIRRRICGSSATSGMEAKY